MPNPVYIYIYIYIYIYCYDLPRPESLESDFFSISHPHILFSLGEGEDGESRSVPSRSEDRENRKLGTSLKTKCIKVWLP